MCHICALRSQQKLVFRNSDGILFCYQNRFFIFVTLLMLPTLRLCTSMYVSPCITSVSEPLSEHRSLTMNLWPARGVRRRRPSWSDNVYIKTLQWFNGSAVPDSRIQPLRKLAISIYIIYIYIVGKVVDDLTQQSTIYLNTKSEAIFSTVTAGQLLDHVRRVWELHRHRQREVFERTHTHMYLSRIAEFYCRYC